MTVDSRLEQLLDQNALAAAEFIGAAKAFPAAGWSTPLAPGKWSVGQHVQHVTLAYEAATRELLGGEPMRPIGTPIRRRFWRLIGLTMAVRFGRLPPATAPREIRPSSNDVSEAGKLDELRNIVSRYEAAIRNVIGQDRARTLSHPYFGPLSLAHAARLLAVHTRHHARALRRSSPR